MISGEKSGYTSAGAPVMFRVTSFRRARLPARLLRRTIAWIV